jgi:ATP-binding cassette subfamily F protein 3
MISNANFLLLDEPTNHLDMQSENILIQALQQYEGSFITVSHNRYFVSNVANKIWWIEDHQVKEYPGTYDEFQSWFAKREASKAEGKSLKAEIKKEDKKDKKTKPRHNTEDAEFKAKQKELSKVEAQIEKLEAEKKVLEEELAKPAVYGNPDKLFEVNQEFDKVNKKLEELTEEWESLIA